MGWKEGRDLRGERSCNGSLPKSQCAGKESSVLAAVVLQVDDFGFASNKVAASLRADLNVLYGRSATR